MDDGKLHLVYLKDQSLWDAVKAVPDLLKGVDQSTDNLVYLTFKRRNNLLRKPRRINH